MRLIDANNLRRYIHEQLESDKSYTADEILKMVDDQCTAVVHCKDCIHWADMCAGCTEHVKLCTVGSYMVGENGYCVYGEKGIGNEIYTKDTKDRRR